jgi:hypothetical protein
MSRNQEEYEQRKLKLSQLHALREEFLDRFQILVNSIMRETAEKIRQANNNPWALREIERDHKKQLEDIRQEFEPFESRLKAEIEAVGTEICHLCWEWMDVIRNEQVQDEWERELWRQELEQEHEDESQDLLLKHKRRVKSKPSKKTKSFDRKAAISFLTSNKQVHDKLPDSKIQEFLRRRSKPKSKNISRV